MSLKCLLHLTAPERQVLTRITKGRCGCQRPTVGKVERARLKCDADPDGADGTDEAIAAAWGAGGAWPWPRIPRPCWSTRPRCREPAGWTARVKCNSCSGPSLRRRPAKLDIADAGPRAGDARHCAPHPLRDGALHAKKRTDALASDPAVLSAGARGGLRGPDGSGVGSL